MRPAYFGVRPAKIHGARVLEVIVEAFPGQVVIQDALLHFNLREVRVPAVSR
jgi:hypothetical protein